MAYRRQTRAVQSKLTNVPKRAEKDDAEARWLELARRAASGSQAALRELYTQFGSLVYSIAFKVLEDSQEAEEATQDVFVKAWKTIGAFDERRCSVRGWLCVMTRSACLDRLRKRKVRPDQIKSKVTAFEPNRDAGAASPVRRLDDRSERLRELLDGLRPEYRQSIELSYFRGYTNREIAEIMGMPEGTVKSFLRRGLIQLREVFAEQ